MTNDTEIGSTVGDPVLAGQLVIAAKLDPPRARLGTVGRPRLARKLLESQRHPLTVLRADAGYGKTTALAQLVTLVGSTHWYGLDPTDRDPLIFLHHLVVAFELDRLGDERASRTLDVLNRTSGAPADWPRVVDVLANELHETMSGDHLLILDDFHLAESPSVQGIVGRLLAHGPQALHLVIGTRRAPGLPGIARLAASGGLVEIGRGDLA